MIRATNINYNKESAYMESWTTQAETATEIERNGTEISSSNETDPREREIHGDIPPSGADIQAASTSTAPPAISRRQKVQAHSGLQGDGNSLKPKSLIISSEAFTQDFTPPDYLIDGLTQRRFIYSLTGNTGAGKTAVALRLAAHVALGTSFGDYEVEQGRVLYFAGENPDDLRMRWIALSEQMRFDRDLIDVHFIVGAETEISKVKGRIEAEVAALGGVSLVIVDTSAAYFNCDECTDENDNVQARKHASLFRSLTTLTGGPTVIVLAHPPKSAKSDNLLPRGGGAFLNEVDGNFVLRKVDALAELHWQGKFRGPEFEPISFELHPVTAETLRDSKDRPIRTVLAVPLSDEDRAAVEASQDQDGNSILALMSSEPGLSLMDMAKVLRWQNTKDDPDKRRAQQTMDRLRRSNLVVMGPTTKRYTLTKKGQQAASAIKPEPASSTVPASQ